MQNQNTSFWWRNITRAALFFVLCTFLWIPYAFAGPETKFRQITQKKDETRLGSSFAFDFYRKIISPVDGDRCAMVPSCSHYSQQSIRKHGWLMGIVMTCDRLIRCGRDEMKNGQIIRHKKQKRIYDPVDHNDFWWK